MRVGIVALMHESNTFITGHTTFERFEQDLLAEGAEVRRRMADAHHEVGGFFAGLDEAKIEAVPIFAARAFPFGTLADETISELLRRMDRALDAAGKLDGLLLAPHGAAVGASIPDVDGYWLGRLRKRVGPAMPMIATLDLHANVSAAMVEACDALIAYRSNPHLDQRQRGLEAARLMVRTLKGEVKPTMAASLLPLAVNIERQLTSQPPCQPMYALADAQLDKPGVLSNSLVLGFPYADVAEMGSSAIVVTHNDPGLARRMVDDLAQAWWDRRREFDGQFITIDEALDRAEKLKGPVCLLDMGDNVGGGSPADATLLAHALYKRRYPASFVCLFDPESVVQASAAGVGRRVSLWVGGKTDSQHGPPLQADFTVRGLYEGKFRESQPRHGGFTEFDQGPTAVVETDAGLTVMLTTRRMVPMSLRQLDSCGLQPANFRFLVAKGVHAPVAAYREVCNDFIRVDTPGVTRADMRQLTYHHRRRPMEPFEQGMTWSASTHQ